MRVLFFCGEKIESRLCIVFNMSQISFQGGMNEDSKQIAENLLSLLKIPKGDQIHVYDMEELECRGCGCYPRPCFRYQYQGRDPYEDGNEEYYCMECRFRRATKNGEICMNCLKHGTELTDEQPFDKIKGYDGYCGSCVDKRQKINVTVNHLTVEVP